MNNYHIITVKAVPCTETDPTKVELHSQLHGNKLVISLTERDAITTAAKYLKEHDFIIVGEGEGQLNGENIRTMFLISDTFKKF